jgi:hypothetical protein
MTEFKSWRSFSNFEFEVRRKLRYAHTPEQAEFLRTVVETSHQRHVQAKEGSNFYRAQLGHDWRDEEQGGHVYQVECAYSRERMKPLRDRASEGRANPKGIPYLYLTTTEKTAILEVRPWVGSYVSVGQFKLLRDCMLIDCSRNHKGFPIYFKEPAAADREKAVWTEIDRAFAEPTTRHDDVAEYAATQIIAELFKREGFDGIAYKSNFGEDGYNTALFDLDAADLINCTVCKVDQVDIEYNECDNRYFVTKYYPECRKPSKPE